jgi:hypothetical protein
MKIDPADIQVMVFEGRKVNPALKQWLKRFPHRKVLAPPTGLRDFLCLWRNHEIAAFLADTVGPPWLLLLDDDMVPVEDTDLLLDCPADLAGAAYWSRPGPDGSPGGIAHGADGYVGAAALKVSRRALSAVEPPWFWAEPDPAGTKLARCECTYFCDKMRAAGFHPVKAGRIGHILPMVVLPDPAGEGFMVRFPSGQ